MLEHLRKQLRNYRTLAYQTYDKFEADRDAALRALCFIHDNRTSRENPVRFDASFFVAFSHAWDDEIEVAAALDRLEWVVPIKGYDSFVPYNTVNIDRPSTVADLAQILGESGPLRTELDRLHLRKALQVFRKNPLSITGQNFFDAAHPRPSDQGAFSNVLTPDWADPAAPTDAEVMDLLDSIRARFGEIDAVKSELIDDDKFTDVAMPSVAFRTSSHPSILMKGTSRRSRNAFGGLSDFEFSSGAARFA